MGRGGMSQSPNSTRRNDRVGNLHNRVKLGNGIFVTKYWGARQGEGQRIVRMKYLFTNKCSDIETLYPSRTRFTRDTTRVGRSGHEWVRIKGFKTLTTFRGPWGHTVVLGQIRVGPKFRGATQGKERDGGITQRSLDPQIFKHSAQLWRVQNPQGKPNRTAQ